MTKVSQVVVLCLSRTPGSFSTIGVSQGVLARRVRKKAFEDFRRTRNALKDTCDTLQGLLVYNRLCCVEDNRWASKATPS